jgi:hypothetical protein
MDFIHHLRVYLFSKTDSQLALLADLFIAGQVPLFCEFTCGGDMTRVAVMNIQKKTAIVLSSHVISTLTSSSAKSQVLKFLRPDVAI